MAIFNSYVSLPEGTQSSHVIPISVGRNPIFDGKIYRKTLYLMVKTMVSCKFSLKPIQWVIPCHPHCWSNPFVAAAAVNCQPGVQLGRSSNSAWFVLVSKWFFRSWKDRVKLVENINHTTIASHIIYIIYIYIYICIIYTVHIYICIYIYIIYSHNI